MDTPSREPVPGDRRLIEVRMSRLAVFAAPMGFMGFIVAAASLGPIVGILAIACGIIARVMIARKPMRLGGESLANIGMVLGACGVTLYVLSRIFLPSLGWSGRSPRTYCQANARGILQSMNVYAADNNGQYPVLPFAPYSTVNALPSDLTSSAQNSSDAAVLELFKPDSPLRGSPMANVWILALQNQISPKQLLCPADPFVSSAAAALLRPTGENYLNLQKLDQLSYAFAYPYLADGSVGKWWKSVPDETVPIMADMPPANGTGDPARNVGPGGPPAHGITWNSPNHLNEGQTVGFADAHAEFCRRPDVGQKDDNIFTFTGVKAVSQFAGVQPGLAPIGIQTDAPPFDIVMVPARNLNTRGLY